MPHAAPLRWLTSLTLAAALAGCGSLATDFEPRQSLGIVQVEPKPGQGMLPVPDAGTGGGTGWTGTGDPCTEFEPNNSVATAAALTPGTYAGLAVCGSELDIFKVQVPAMTVLTGRLDFNAGVGNLDLYFSDGTVDAQGYISVFASSASTTFSQEEILNEPFAQETTVYVVVAGKSGAQGTYDLTLTTSAGVPDRDCFTGCTTLTPFPGATSWSSPTAKADGYYLSSASKYSWGRADLAGLMRYAAASVKARFPGTADDPVAVGDICQQDGLTPGVDVGSPRHPTTTHVRGKDIDVAYYQTDGVSNYQIVCGAGTDTNGNGRAGTYNDGYFCTTDTNVVDVPRQVWFLAKLAESPNFRVVGVDQTFVPAFRAEAQRLYAAGDIGVTQYRRVTEGLGYGEAGGWQFHHHHLHLSLYE